MQIINWIDTFMTPIVWFINLSHKVFQILTSPRAKQIYKAIVLFISILCIAIALGFAKTLQMAFISASEAFVEALELSVSTEILTVKESEPVTPEIQTAILTVKESEPPMPETIVPDSVRSLRKAATAKGIANASRMKKADLLVALSYSGDILSNPTQAEEAITSL